MNNSYTCSEIPFNLSFWICALIAVWSLSVTMAAPAIPGLIIPASPEEQKLNIPGHHHHGLRQSGSAVWPDLWSPYVHQFGYYGTYDPGGFYNGIGVRGANPLNLPISDALLSGQQYALRPRLHPLIKNDRHMQQLLPHDPGTVIFKKGFELEEGLGYRFDGKLRFPDFDSGNMFDLKGDFYDYPDEEFSGSITIPLLKPGVGWKLKGGVRIPPTDPVVEYGHLVNPVNPFQIPVTQHVYGPQLVVVN